MLHKSSSLNLHMKDIECIWGVHAIYFWFHDLSLLVVQRKLLFFKKIYSWFKTLFSNSKVNTAWARDYSICLIFLMPAQCSFKEPNL